MKNAFDQNSIFLVTGGAGFIGSNLCETLVEMGYAVRCFDDLSSGSRGNISHLEGNEQFSFVQGDISSLEDCREACAGVDYVLHNAALSSVVESMQNPEKYRTVNVGGMENMLQAAMEAGVKKFVFASSAAVYGDAGKRVAKEGEEGKPLSVYAETKWENEQQAKRYAAKGLDVYGLRYFNVYGKRQRHDSPYSAVIPNFMDKLLRGVPARINGDGLQTRDFVYVADVVQANLKACLADRKYAGEAFNIGCGGEISVLELYQTIASAVGSDMAPVHGPVVQGDIRFSCADIQKAEKILGYKPEYSFAEGICISVEWYQKNI